jgi:hypothetical protein
MHQFVKEFKKSCTRSIFVPRHYESAININMLILSQIIKNQRPTEKLHLLLLLLLLLFE